MFAIQFSWWIEGYQYLSLKMQTPTFNTKFKKKKKIKKITLLLRQKSVWGGFTLSHEHQQLATSTITTTIPGNGEMKRSDNSPSSTSEAGDKLFLQTLFSCQEFILVFNSICVLPSILAIKERYVSRTVSRWFLLVCLGGMKGHFVDSR